MAKQSFTTGKVLTAAQLLSLQQTAMLGGAASAKTASYTLVAADAGTAISMSNASATTITVNTALFAAGDTVQITNLGAGVCTITAGTATVNTASSLALAQYESGTLDFDSTSSAIFIKGAGASASSGFDPLFNIEYAGYYYRPTSGTVASAAIIEDVTWYLPIFLSAQSFDRISCRTATGFVGTATARLGLYNASTTTGKPTTVVFDAGTVSCTAANTNYEITITQSVSSGWYFLAFNTQTVAATNEFVTTGTGANSFASGILPTYSTVQGSTNSIYYSQTGVTGAFATAGTLVAPATSAPIVALRIA